MTLDHSNKRLYTHAYSGSDESNEINVTNYDGNYKRQIIRYHSAGSLSSLDVVGNTFYWNTRSSPIIMKINISNKETLRYIPLPKDYTVKKLLVVDKSRQPVGRFILFW